MKINQTFIHTIKGIAIGLVLVAGISYVQAAWAPPAGAPSEANNAPAPINVSSSNQSKEGWLLVGGTGAPLSALDVSNGTDTAQAVADMALVTKTSRFVQTAKFGDLITGSTSGKVNVLGSEAKVNIGFGEVTLLGATPEKLNVSGSILSSDLQNEGPGIDITDKGNSINNVWAAMLCADTNGKIVLCKDIDVPGGVWEPDPALSVTYTYNGVSEDNCSITYEFTAVPEDAEGTVSYSWTYTDKFGSEIYSGSGNPKTITIEKENTLFVSIVEVTASAAGETDVYNSAPISIPAESAVGPDTCVD